MTRSEKKIFPLNKLIIKFINHLWCNKKRKISETHKQKVKNKERLRKIDDTKNSLVTRKQCEKVNASSSY